MRVELDGGVMTIVNDDPPINRMTLDYMDGVEQAVEQAADDPSVRVLVFTAEGTENFSVGMDLNELMGGVEDRGGFEGVLDQRRRVLHRIEHLGKPSIATLFGYCLGVDSNSRLPATSDWPPTRERGSAYPSSTWEPCPPGVARSVSRARSEGRTHST